MTAGDRAEHGDCGDDEQHLVQAFGHRDLTSQAGKLLSAYEARTKSLPERYIPHPTPAARLALKRPRRQDRAAQNGAVIDGD
jgi:hypothetical protein